MVTKNGFLPDFRKDKPALFEEIMMIYSNWDIYSPIRFKTTFEPSLFLLARL